MSQLRREERTKPKVNQFSHLKKQDKTSFEIKGREEVDASISFDLDDIQESLTQLMSDDLRKNYRTNKGKKCSDPGQSRIHYQPSSKSQNQHGSILTNSANPQTKFVQMNPSLAFSNQVSINHPLQFQPALYGSLNYNSPYLMNTSSFFPTPMYYQQYYIQPQPVNVCRIAKSMPIQLIYNDKSEAAMPSRRNQAKPKKESDECMSQSSNSTDESEDIDIVLDFINKCPSHLDFILKNKSEAARLLNSTNFSNAKFLYKCLLKDLEQLMLDSYGNYFCQELFRFLSSKERLKAWSIINNNLALYGTHQYAHHVLQLLIELSIEQEQMEIIRIVKPAFSTLITDSKGSHIIQKLINCFYGASKIEVVHFLLENFMKIISNANGVCAVKMYIKTISTESSNQRLDFYKLIVSNLGALANDKSAHYALLCILDEWSQSSYLEISEHLADNFASYSTMKYASRLIEKSLNLENKVSLSFNNFQVLYR